MIAGDSAGEVPFFWTNGWTGFGLVVWLFGCCLFVCPGPAPPQNRLASSIPFTFSEKPLYVLDDDLHNLYSSFWLTYTAFQQECLTQTHMLTTNRPRAPRPLRTVIHTMLLEVVPVLAVLLAMGAAVAGKGTQAVVFRPTPVGHLPPRKPPILLL